MTLTQHTVAQQDREKDQNRELHCEEKAAVDIMMSCSLRLNMRSLFMRIMVALLACHSVLLLPEQQKIKELTILECLSLFKLTLLCFANGLSSPVCS